MQKIAKPTEVMTSSTTAPSMPGIAPETLDLVAPLAAMALMGYGGYALANKLSDKRAEREREERLKGNLNKLQRTNLERLALSRGMTPMMPKEAAEDSSLFGTMFNPFQGMAGMPGGQVYVPKWFNVSGTDKPGQLEKVLAKTMMLGGTYGTLGFSMKYLMNALERKKEAQQGTSGIQSAVKAAMPVVSPDPYLSDLDDEAKKEAMGLEEEESYGDLIDKTAENGEPSMVAEAMAKLRYKQSNPRAGSLSGTAKALLTVAALGSMGAGAVLTKRWADDRDENRQRIKAAEKAARLRALQEKPPTLINDIDPDIEEQLDAHIKGGRLKIKPRSLDLGEGAASQLPVGTLEEQEIDPTDSLAQNIAVV